MKQLLKKLRGYGITEPREGARKFRMAGHGVADFEDIRWYRQPQEHPKLPEALQGEIVGWSEFLKPAPGDMVIIPMRSGKKAVWLVQSTEPQSNPRDMYFAVLAGPFGYENDPFTDEVREISFAV